MEKKWQVLPKIKKEFISQFPEINPLVLQLLYNRGLDTQAKIDEFLNPDWGQDIHDPFLFLEMEKAVERIFRAIKKQEKIAIFGDYDADGVSASALLVSVLEALGSKPEIYIPYRATEGYGLNEKAVLELASKKVNLIITVDCGISNFQEVKLAQDKKIDVIITDHHYPLPDIPKALAIINPKVKGETYPFKNLAGVGVAFKLASALIKKSKQVDKKLPDGFVKWLLDLVAIGTVADCVPILGENRTLVKYGLLVLGKTKRIGLRELARVASIDLKNVDTYNIAFQIAPRLNAAGRLDHASTAYQLLLTVSEVEAQQIASQLQEANQARQRLTDQLVSEAKKQIGEVGPNERILFAVGDGWPAGVIGVVAGKIADEYYRPTIIMGRDEYEIIGSGRSIPNFNIIETLLKLRKYLSRYGGHNQACGFTITNETYLSKFQSEFEALAKKALSGQELKPVLKIEAEIDLAETDWKLWQILQEFEPFGADNPRPRFLSKGLTITALDCVGNGQHLKIMINQGGNLVRRAIGFGLGDWARHLKVGDQISLVYELIVNEWNGTQELQFKIIDLKSKK